MNLLTLNNDIAMPALGLGVFQTPPDETRAAVEAALATGYRHICFAGTCTRAARSSPSRPSHTIAENFDVFDFDLTADELAAIDSRDTDRRGGPEPTDITLESFGREIPEA